MRSSLKRWGFAIWVALGPCAWLVCACGPTDLFIGEMGGADSGDGADRSVPSDGWFPDGWVDAPKSTCEQFDASDAGWFQPVAMCQCLESSCCSELNECTSSVVGSRCDPFANCYFQCMRGQWDAGLDGDVSDVYDASSFDLDADDAAAIAFDDDSGDGDGGSDGGGLPAHCESWCSGEEGAAAYGALLRCARSECGCAFWLARSIVTDRPGDGHFRRDCQ